MQRLRSALRTVRTFLGLNSLATGGLAVLTLLVALLIFLFLPELQTTARALVALALLLLVLFVVGAYSDVKTGLLARQTRYGTNTGIMVVAFIGIMGLVNVIAAQNSQRMDLTAGGQYTLSRHTLTVLKNLKEPVKITGFFDAPSQGLLQRAKNLLVEYRYHTDKISFDFVDLEEKPGIARQYEVREAGALVFEAGQRRKQIFGIGEQDFTGALLNVTGVEQPKVYFIVGHGEHDIESSDRGGFGFAKQGLETDNYQVLSLNLSTVDRVPAEAALLVLAGPQRPLLAPEVRLLNDYLEAGGKAMFLLDPNPSDELKKALARWGVTFKDGTVVDTSIFVNPDTTTPAVQGNQYRFSQITKDLAATFFPGAAGMEIAIPEDDRDHVFVAPLAITSQQSFLETDRDKISLDEGKDPRGPFPLAVTVEANKPIGQRPPRPASGASGSSAPEPQITRLVVFADSDFASNDFFYSLGNGDFFLNSANWLTAQQELISIRPKPPEFRRLVITQRAWNFILYSSIAFWPLAVLFAGAVVWWRRR